MDKKAEDSRWIQANHKVRICSRLDTYCLCNDKFMNVIGSIKIISVTATYKCDKFPRLKAQVV
jgi:hypothetical protein